MQNSLYAWPFYILNRETAWIRGTSITGFHLSVFIYPTCGKMEWKGAEKEPKIMWKKLQPSKEMFDIDLDCEGGVHSQMCVFVIKQVNLSSEAESKDYFFLLADMFYCCFPARAPQPSISPTSMVWPHPLIKSSFWKTILLIWILPKENVHTFIQATARRVCLWNALSQILRFCLNKQSDSF